MGGTIWSRAQPGPVTNYSKNIMKTEKSEPLLNKVEHKISCFFFLFFLVQVIQSTNQTSSS